MQATETLKKVRRYYENALQSNTYQKWLQEARNAWAFYDGQQWGNDEITALKEKGQPPIVINKIAPKVDNIAGTEIAGRTRVVYRSRSGELSEEETAKALSDLALYVAERNDQAIEISNMFKAGLVTGIGWLDTGVEQAEEGPFIFNRHENELHVIWDPAARRMDYSDARFVCRERWIDGEEAKHLFPDSFEKILKQRQGNIFSAHEDIAYFNSEEDLFRVVEVQY